MSLARGPLTPSMFEQRLHAKRTPDDVMVLRVQPKCELAVGRYGAVVHRFDEVIAIIDAGRVRYSASWLCGAGSPDVVLLATADAHGGDICRNCKNAVPGIFVYRCFNAAGQLLYVGSTIRFAMRMASHHSSTRWWPQVADVTREPHPSLPAARAAERNAVRAEKPLYNRQWAVAS